ncbi:MAG TPA: glycoside hydrolase family 43 protein [Humisphaera sp.]|jgi:GH43 family beta-xylosidase|nr:glycoside hydrolase family 43 protein [Humisphaera sp.]
MLAYSNPVYDGYFADPFVLKTQGVYYAYGTGHGPERDGRQFPILRSTDLATWSYVGGALAALEPEAGSKPFTAYWAPEVAERDGRFFMYYSAASGGDETHRLRVAISHSPEGPFIDVGRVKLSGDFADVFCIDASPFRDPADGQWYLYFATDFFTERVGTGTAVVPLADDMRSAAGPAKIVLRAAADWEIYERNRPLYGKIWAAWHTVEGPSVWRHEGRYYCFYSGGNWQTELYGVGVGVADQAMGPFTDLWSLQGPSVLRGVEGEILGPGHNCIVLGPDGQTEYIVYHAWDAARTARRMFIDPLRWEVDRQRGIPRPICDGPTLGSAARHARARKLERTEQT